MIRWFALQSALWIALLACINACKTTSNGNDASRAGGLGGLAHSELGGSSANATGGVSGNVAGTTEQGGGGRAVEMGGVASATGGKTGGIASGSGGTVINTGGLWDASTGGIDGGSGGTAKGSTGGTIHQSTGGASAGGQQVATCILPKTLWTGSSSRPQLTDEAAACFTIQHYLSASGSAGSLTPDAWDPTAGLEVSKFPIPNFTVAADGSGSHKTVQEAIDAATGSQRVYILIKPGVYREPVCVNQATPITLFAADPDATKVRITNDNYSGKEVAGTKSNACQIPSTSTYGTTNSSTFFVKSSDFQAVNLTIANDFTGSGQAVAMTSHGDKVMFQNVRFYGFQDTLNPSAPANGMVMRSYFKSCFIQGDTDFIMGSGVAVFDACEINYIGTRKNGGCHLAPSTDGRQMYGMLIIHSHIIGGEGTKAGGAKLGRAWNASSNPDANGQVVIRDTEIDGHINTAAPWDTSTGGSKKPFDPDKNRMFEYKNKGSGAAK